MYRQGTVTWLVRVSQVLRYVVFAIPLGLIPVSFYGKHLLKCKSDCMLRSVFSRRVALVWIISCTRAQLIRYLCGDWCDLNRMTL